MNIHFGEINLKHYTTLLKIKSLHDRGSVLQKSLQESSAGLGKQISQQTLFNTIKTEIVKSVADYSKMQSGEQSQRAAKAFIIFRSLEGAKRLISA